MLWFGLWMAETLKCWTDYKKCVLKMLLLFKFSAHTLISKFLHHRIMWIVRADYISILLASSDHLTLRASIILWLKCPLLAAVVFHFALHSISLLCKKPYYLQIFKSSILHFLQLGLNLHTEGSVDMNPLDLSTEKFCPYFWQIDDLMLFSVF